MSRRFLRVSGCLVSVIPYRGGAVCRLPPPVRRVCGETLPEGLASSPLPPSRTLLSHSQGHTGWGSVLSSDWIPVVETRDFPPVLPRGPSETNLYYLLVFLQSRRDSGTRGSRVVYPRVCMYMSVYVCLYVFTRAYLSTCMCLTVRVCERASIRVCVCV